MDLSGFKILAFATRGLVPGELNGLTQPALALSVPAVAGIGSDGLLTMEEILTLKLDADWVALSACNTGAGAGHVRNRRRLGRCTNEHKTPQKPDPQTSDRTTFPPRTAMGNRRCMSLWAINGSRRSFDSLAVIDRARISRLGRI
jgi:CHAT domain